MPFAFGPFLFPPILCADANIPCSASNRKRLRGIQIIIKGSLNGCPLKIAFCCPAGGALYPARRACGEARPSGVEHVFVQAAEGLLHAGERQRQIHADVARAVEGTAVLPGHAHVPAGALLLPWASPQRVQSRNSM